MPRTWDDDSELAFAEMDHNDDREPETAEDADPEVLDKLTGGRHSAVQRQTELDKVIAALNDSGFLGARLRPGVSADVIVAAIAEAGAANQDDRGGYQQRENPNAREESMPVSMSLSSRGGLQPVPHRAPDDYVMQKLTGGKYRGRTTPHNPSADADRSMLERLGRG